MSDLPGECGPSSATELPDDSSNIANLTDEGWRVDGDPVWTQHPTEDGVHFYDRIGR